MSGLDFTYLALVAFGLFVFICSLLARVARWSFQVVKSKHRRRHAARRRARAKGYIPIYDEQIDPMELLKR